jgi:hypothetical protein
MPSNYLYNKDNCSEWRKNPLINPISNRPIKKDGPIYKLFKKNCDNNKKTSPNKDDNIYNKDNCNEWNSKPLINPISNKPIKKNGAIYKLFKKNCDDNKKPSPNKDDNIYSKNNCDKWNSKPLINPISNRPIKKDGPIYKLFKKNCNKDKIISSQDKPLSNKDLCKEWLKNPLINPITKKNIKSTGAIYKKYLKLCSKLSSSSSVKPVPSRSSSVAITARSRSSSSSVKPVPSRSSSSAVKQIASRSSSVSITAPSRSSSVAITAPSRSSSVAITAPSRSSSVAITAPSRSSSTSAKPVASKTSSYKSANSNSRSSSYKSANSNSRSSSYKSGNFYSVKSISSRTTSFVSPNSQVIITTPFSKSSTKSSKKYSIKKNLSSTTNKDNYFSTSSLTNYFLDDRINKYNIIYEYIKKIYTKYDNNCIKKYKIVSGRQLLRIGNKIILENKLGRSGSYGVVYKSYYRETRKNVYKPIIKFAVKICEINEINTQEIAIARELTKYLIEANIMHFPILYGYLECNTNELHDVFSSEPDSGSLKYTHSSFNSNIYNALLNKSSLYFQIYEIANGNTDSYYAHIIDDSTDKIKSNELVFNALAQLFMSIYYFHIVLGMQHNDTHFGNFLYHKIELGLNFKYTLDAGVNFYIKNIGYLWVINDFGLAKPLTTSNKISQILADYKTILDNAQEYSHFYINNDIINFIKEVALYLDKDLYVIYNSSEDVEKKIIINIMNCFLKYSNSVAKEDSA